MMICANTDTVGAAVLIPLIHSRKETYLYLQVRSQFVRQPGEICLPGGHTNPGETPEETALRETEEELGLPKECFKVLGYLPGIRRRDGMVIQPVVASAEEELLPELKIDRKEVEEVFELPLDFLLKNPAKEFTWEPGITKEEEVPPGLRKYLIKYNYPLTTCYWEYGNKGIWGLTARILKIFVDKYPEI